jgi:hypothetical protein
MQAPGSPLNDVSCLSFRDLLIGFALDAESGYGTGFESLNANVLATLFADAKLAVVKTLDRFLNLENQLPLAVADAQNGITVGLHGCAITGVGEVLILVHVIYGLAGFRAQLGDALIEKITEKFNFFLIHWTGIRSIQDSKFSAL